MHVRVNKVPTLAYCDTPEAGGDGSFPFIEGLWTGDCAELFLSNPNTGFYIELNLSPVGSWWFCAFTAPHCRLLECAVPPGVITTASIPTSSGAPDNWSASLTIPLLSLPLELEFDPHFTTGNVTFCLHDNIRRPNKELFFSYYKLGDNTLTSPNFHIPQKWRKILLEVDNRRNHDNM